ncbi:NUDIX domain-containing protein [Nocardia sp. NPDC048505]|uniref:NUDIX hydrolase n=1 Tax=Nocardia sp. NPDC048505 TaxID=3155756 RepID=UPI0033F6B872
MYAFLRSRIILELVAPTIAGGTDKFACAGGIRPELVGERAVKTFGRCRFCSAGRVGGGCCYGSSITRPGLASSSVFRPGGTFVTSTDSARRIVRDLAASITTGDEVEQAARAFALEWIDSGAPLFRVRKPDLPPIHLCSYAVLFDRRRRSVLLADHVNAQAWLPPGGHVDDLEDPRATVLREVREELGIDAEFDPLCGGEPIFLSVTRTRGASSHWDVTFWFVLAGDEDTLLQRDPAEAHELRWWPIEQAVLFEHAEQFDPCWSRFLDKLRTHGHVDEPVR